LNLFKPLSLARYVFYGIPIQLVFIIASIILYQWLSIIIQLTAFARVFDSAKQVVKLCITGLVALNILLAGGIFGFWITAWVWRNAGRGYQEQNIVMGIGYAWISLMVIIFQSIIFFTSSKLTTMLTDGNNIQNPEISEIVARVYIQKIFIYFYIIYLLDPHVLIK